MKGPCPTIPISTCVREQCKHIRILCLHHYDGYQREIAYAQHVHCNLCPLTGMIDPGIAFLGRQVFTASVLRERLSVDISLRFVYGSTMCAVEVPACPQVSSGGRPARHAGVCFGGWWHTLHEGQVAEGTMSERHTVEIRAQSPGQKGKSLCGLLVAEIQCLFYVRCAL